MRRLLLTVAAPLALNACSDKCPEGYEQNDETQQCVEITSGSDGADGTTDTDGADGGSDGADGADGADGTDGSDGGSDGADGGDGGSLPDDALNGTVVISGIVDGELEAWKAFSHEATSEVTGGNLLLVYMSSSPDATCADATSYLLAEGNDPSSLFPDNVCNLTMQFFRPSFGTHSEEAPLSLTNGGSVSVFIECAFGYGAWQNTSVEGRSGWYWLGDGSLDSGSDPEDVPRWYQGQAVAGEVTQLETSGSGYEIILEPDEYAGVFPFDDDLGTSGARGTGKGVIRTEDCGSLQDTRYFTAPPEDR